MALEGPFRVLSYTSFYSVFLWCLVLSSRMFQSRRALVEKRTDAAYAYDDMKQPSFELCLEFSFLRSLTEERFCMCIFLFIHVFVCVCVCVRVYMYVYLFVFIHFGMCVIKKMM